MEMTNTRRDLDNTTTTSNTQPGVLTAEEEDRFMRAYLGNVATMMTAAVADLIREELIRGATVEDLIYAAEETGLAPRPSPAYFRAVLRNRGKRKDKKQQRYFSSYNPALDYTQRPVDEAVDYVDNRFIELAEQYRKGR